MNMSESLQALRGANPRTRADFGKSVESATAVVREVIDAHPRVEGPETPSLPRRRPRSSLVGASLGAAAVVVAGLVAGLLSHGPGAESAAAAVRKAAARTASTAERSGTATVRITHDGELWAAKTVSWNGNDLSLADTLPGRDGRRPGSEMRVVDGIMYSPDPAGRGWLRLGGMDSVEPDSGTTPEEYLAAMRQDVGGMTLRRLSNGITGMTTRSASDGSTIYGGMVAAGLVARETGVKEGQPIRVLPFGYVAHDEAAEPASPLHAAVTVDADGIVSEIAVSWGTWRYSVAYSGLGATPAPVAPANARGLRDR